MDARRGLWAVVPVLLTAHCTCQEALTELVPDIDVDDRPRELARQVVGRGALVDVQVGNRGTGVLNVSAAVEPADQGFVIERVPSEIRPNEALVIAMTFTPPGRAQYSAELIITSNDPDEGEIRIALSGEGGPPQLLVEPLAVDLGLVNEGGAVEQIVRISNVGFDVMAGLAVEMEIGGLFGIDTGALPPSIPAGEAASMLVWLAPSPTIAAQEDASGLVHDALLVSSTDGGSQRVPVQGACNLAPTAVAVELLTRVDVVKSGVGKPIQFDGSDSFDPEGDPLQYFWALFERPLTSVAQLVDPENVTTRLTPDEVGEYGVGLLVVDRWGATSIDEVHVLPRDLSVVLRWDTEDTAPCQSLTQLECAALPPDERDDVCCGQSDLDLHVIRPNGTLGDTGMCPGGCTMAMCTEFSEDNMASCRQMGTDCGWANRAPEWGTMGRADDPRLDVDDVRGNGPEVISLDAPADGAYRAVVHYCTDRIGEPTLATIEVYVEGVLQQTAGPELLEQGDAWTATTLVRSAGQWSFVSPPGVIDAAPPGLCSP